MKNVIMAYSKPAHRSNPRVISIHPVEIPCWRLEPQMKAAAALPRRRMMAAAKQMMPEKDGNSRGDTGSCFSLFQAVRLWLQCVHGCTCRFSENTGSGGQFLDADGNPVCGVHVSFAWEDTLKICTDRDRAFCFDGLKKGIRQLEISRSGEKTLLSMNVCVGGRDKEEAFQSSPHCLSVNHMQKKNDYVVGVRL